MKKTIMITGRTGFLGKRLGLALKDEYKVMLTGRNNKMNMYTRQFTGCKVIPMDIVNIESVRDTIVSTKPKIIIHTAATKFVDLTEIEPLECIDVNVVGSQNIAQVAVDNGIFVKGENLRKSILIASFMAIITLSNIQSIISNKFIEGFIGHENQFATVKAIIPRNLVTDLINRPLVNILLGDWHYYYTGEIRLLHYAAKFGLVWLFLIISVFIVGFFYVPKN